jgi:hypothetical protein
LYIFVLYIDPNGQCVLPVYFWSLHQPIRTILLHQWYNIIFCNNTIYCFESRTNEVSWDSIFLIKSRMRNIIYCCSDTNLLFLSHNKLYFNDQINCFIINACIFLFSTLSKTVCLLSLYIFCLRKYLSDLFYCIRVTKYCFESATNEFSWDSIFDKVPHEK